MSNGDHSAVNPKNNRPSPMISKETYEAVMENEDRLNSAVIYDRDFTYVGRTPPYCALPTVLRMKRLSQNYFGYKTLERSYLLRINGKVAERPQHLLMRVAVGIHGKDVAKAIESYNLVRPYVIPFVLHPDD